MAREDPEWVVEVDVYRGDDSTKHRRIVRAPNLFAAVAEVTVGIEVPAEIQRIRGHLHMREF